MLQYGPDAPQEESEVMRMSEGRRRAPALATRVDDQRPDQKNWETASTAPDSCPCGVVLPDSAEFCPGCGKKRGEESVVVEPGLGAVKMLAPAHLVVEVRSVAQAPVPAPAQVFPPAPAAARQQPIQPRKGARTLLNEADKEGRNFLWFAAFLTVALLIGGVVWVLTSSRRYQAPAPLPVSTMPISLLPRSDAGTD